jgi:hypothetical protein
MLECQTVQHLISLIPERKTNNAGTDPVPDQAKAVRPFLFYYRTEIIDAEMLMPALVSSMPMPTYVKTYLLILPWILFYLMGLCLILIFAIARPTRFGCSCPGAT